MFLQLITIVEEEFNKFFSVETDKVQKCQLFYPFFMVVIH